MNSQNLIYLDHAAATPIDKRILKAMQPYYSDLFFNPSSPYWPAVGIRRIYQSAKQNIASLIGGKASEIVITAGATESINLAFNNIKGEVLTLDIEHLAVLASASKHKMRYFKTDKFGRLDINFASTMINGDTELISVALANNELGTIQPISQLAELVKQERQKRLVNNLDRPILLHCDASQAVGLIDINVARLGVDMLTVNAGKMYGPKQVGCLWFNSNVNLKPLIVGGGQENNLRSGTENVAGVVGLAKALELAKAHRQNQVKNLKKLRDYMQDNLKAAFPEMVISSHKKYCLPNYLHISFPGLDGERLVFLLEEKDVLVSTGSACSADKATGSHVLSALKFSGDVIQGSLRITLGRLNNEVNIKKATNIIIKTVKTEYERLNR